MGKRYLYNRCSETDKAWIAEGRGQGEGTDYSCWRRRQEENYDGTCSRRWDDKLGRMQELFGWPQIRFNLEMAYRDDIVDRRENFPLLPGEETAEIAEMLCFDHPRYDESGDRKILLQDFLLTLEDGSMIAVAILRKNTLNSVWRRRQFEIQQVYWSRRNVQFQVVYVEMMNIIFSNNLRSVFRSNMLGPESYPAEALAEMKFSYNTTTLPVVSLARKIEQQFSLAPGLGLNVFWELVRRKEIVPDMEKKPLNLLEERPLPSLPAPEKTNQPEASAFLPPLPGQAWQYTGEKDKAELENKFHQINHFIGRIPGKVTADGAHEKNACVTLDELNGIIIDFILAYNESAVIDPQPAADLVGVDLMPTPEAYWNWGILHRGGLLRSFSQDQVQVRFLPLESANITENGLQFRKLRYSCEYVRDRLYWFVKARNKTPVFPGRENPYQAMVRYDPTRVDTIWWYDPDQGDYLPLSLIGEYRDAFGGFTFEETDMEFERRAALISAQAELQETRRRKYAGELHRLICSAIKATHKALHGFGKLRNKEKSEYRTTEIERQMMEDLNYVEQERRKTAVCYQTS